MATNSKKPKIKSEESDPAAEKESSSDSSIDSDSSDSPSSASSDSEEEKAKRKRKAPAKKLAGAPAAKRKLVPTSDDEKASPRKKKTIIEDPGNAAGGEEQSSSNGVSLVSETTRSLDSFVCGSAPVPATPSKKQQKSRDHFLKSPPPIASTNTDEQLQNEAQLDLDECYWVKPDQRRDINKKRPGEPGFDPTTIFVPEKAMKEFTPGQKQYWEIKSRNYDLVLFFKVGKFYELFDEDAHVGVKELGLNYMKAKRPHSGFPEVAFDKYAQQLVALGYKVGRVDQVETPEMLAARNKNQGTKDKAVRRDMTAVLTPGTITEPDMIGKQGANYFLAVCDNEATKTFGVCFVDTSTGRFHIGQFEDDKQGTRLRTLLAQVHPTEVVFPYGMSKRSQELLRSELMSGCTKTMMKSEEFWNSTLLLKNLTIKKYFPESEGKDVQSSLPEALQLLFEKKQDSALSALGGCLCYLTRLLLDKELMSLNRFSLYDPASVAENLVLDGQTLVNLEILLNTEGTTEGTLLKHMDHCASPGGKRLLREWVSRPLGNKMAIDDRLNAVEDIMKNELVFTPFRKNLKSVPDLERMLARIHANGIKNSAAIMYENVTSKKIEIFFKTLAGFRTVLSLFKEISSHNIAFTSKRLKSLATVGEGFPDISATLEFFQKAFNEQECKRAGFIKPERGVDQEYDDAEKAVTDLEKQLDNFLKTQQAHFKSAKVAFWDRGKEARQLEIPVAVLEKVGIPDDFECLSQSKTVKRYATPFVKKIGPLLDAAKQKQESLLEDITRRMFCKFSEHQQEWQEAVACLNEVDCLTSLALTSKYQEGGSCRPEIVNSDSPILELVESTHPCLTSKGSAFIPNDISVGNPRFLLVSGPNMGGKSTLLRQACVIVIMAQMGCYVPATSCRMTPMDRIFTRVGANDRIMQGVSTFLVELEETANILRHATSHSLVILDELGRGTSTFDGTAIAWAVIEYLCRQTRCLTLFSTHYHMLMEEYGNDKDIDMFHMACVLSPNSSDVTFLYKFRQGICPKSHGMNVAKLAGLPDSVVTTAGTMSSNFEKTLEAAHGTRDQKLVAVKVLKGLEAKDLKSLRLLHSFLPKSC